MKNGQAQTGGGGMPQVGAAWIQRVPWIGGGVVLLLAATAFMALVGAPADAVQGDAQRLMYLHVPAAWLAYLAFTVTAIASVLWLLPRTRSTTWDLLAGASAEVGVLFTGLTLAMGSIWGKPIWGSWWEWDARLTTTAVLFFLYLGYLALRAPAAAPTSAPSAARSPRSSPSSTCRSCTSR